MTYELYQGDCLEYMRGMDAGSVDCVVTDPPYGINVTKMNLGNGKQKIYRGNTEWDRTPSNNVFEEIIKLSNHQIIWGGNYFANLFPPSRCWLVWDKYTGNNDYADCELAWTNLDKVVKKYNKPWVGANAKDTTYRVHPTQKPVELMKWCIELISSPGDTIFDPFMGSGTTGVAALQLGRHFIGCELDPGYFAIAQARIEAAARQPSLFQTTPAAVQPQQSPLFGQIQAVRLT